MKRDYAILLVIFILVLFLRLVFVSQTPYFSDDSAYYNLRHTDYISENHQPMIFDELSYGGRYVIDSHIFHLMLAGFNSFLPYFVVFKLLPEILFALLIFIVYAIAKRLTANTTAPLLAALISGFIPIFMANTVNTLSVYSLVLPLIFYQVYCLMNIETHRGRFIVLSFLLPIIHPFTAILAISFVLYAVLLSIESIKMKKAAKEAVLFFVLLVSLLGIIVYKKAFIEFGIYAVLQNVPSALFSSYFQGINLLSLIYNIGIIPLILGSLGIVFGISWEKNDSAFLLSGLVLADFILLFLRLINFNTGMIFLGILLSILSAISISKAISYIKLTKFSKFKNSIFVVFIVLIVILLGIPSYTGTSKAIEKTVSSDEIAALEWLRGNSEQDSTVLGNINEGNLIEYIAQRKTVADSLFMFAPDRYDDVKLMLTTESLVKATQLMHKHSVDYVLMSQSTKDMYNMEDLKYAKTECFEEVFVREKAKVYRLVC
ncbi:MAG: hypothetical protein PHO02_02375 [Candidatus Nanoarchaeia archaeon]|nr:hypothetical protein [Candidatus Nanoarchaeia archaeon]